MSQGIVAALPIAAAVLAVPQFVPQLLRVHRRGATAGVSWTWSAMTCINNAAWMAYFALSGYTSALIPAAAAVLFSGLLATQLAVHLQALPRRSIITIATWSLLLAAAGIGYGRVGLGTGLAAAFFLQVAPAVWTAYRSNDVSGISVGTWLLIFGELACFGLFGLAESDPRLTVLGATGVCASLLMLGRVTNARTRHADEPLRGYPRLDVRRWPGRGCRRGAWRGCSHCGCPRSCWRGSHMPCASPGTVTRSGSRGV